MQTIPINYTREYIDDDTKTEKSEEQADSSTHEKQEQKKGEHEKHSYRRYFKLITNTDTKETRGRFSGFKPKQAANKALTSLLKTMKGGKKTEKIKFSIIECTKGSKGKVYHYTGQRIELEHPMTVTIKDNHSGQDRTIVYKYQNNIMKDCNNIIKDCNEEAT